MLYSNEVYLVNSSYGRVVDSDVLTLNEIDIESSLLEFNDRIHRDRVEGFKNRIFKLIDVYFPEVTVVSQKWQPL